MQGLSSSSGAFFWSRDELFLEPPGWSLVQCSEGSERVSVVNDHEVHRCLLLCHCLLFVPSAMRSSPVSLPVVAFCNRLLLVPIKTEAYGCDQPLPCPKYKPLSVQEIGCLVLYVCCWGDSNICINLCRIIIWSHSRHSNIVIWPIPWIGHGSSIIFL